MSLKKYSFTYFFLQAMLCFEVDQDFIRQF